MSTSDGKAERELLREAFAKLVPANRTEQITPFGHLGRRIVGVYDGNQSVQWNSGTFLDRGQWVGPVLGVNLEGLEYNGGRPLYRLIKNELENPLIFGTIRILHQPQMIGVTLARDAWYGPTSPRARPLYYLDRFVLPGAPRKLTENAWSTALPVDELTEDEWHHSLETSLDCFDNSGASVWRGITFYNPRTGHPESEPRAHQYEMTPHLNFRCALSLDAPVTWSTLVKVVQNPRNLGKPLGETWPEGKDALIEAMQRAQHRLQPLYDFVKEHSG